MKKLLLILLPVLLLCGCKNDDKPREWEYKTVQVGTGIIEEMYKTTDMLPNDFGDPTEKLNQLGKEGWELVGMYTELMTAYPNFGNAEYHTGIKTNTKTKSVTFVFKRPKTSDNNNDYGPHDTNTVVVEEAVEEVVVDEAEPDSVVVSL